MKLKTILIYFLVCIQYLNGQNIDTFQLKSEVLEIKGLESQKLFLKKIFEEDQKYRGKMTKEKLDFQHLISIAYFINQYGYPTKAVYGKYSSTPSLVWIHNKYQEIDQITFPIILKGFLEKEITEFDLRNYYLRGIYSYKFDSQSIKNIPLKKLFEICDLNLEEKISINKLLAAKSRIDSCNNLKVVRETLWKAKDSYKTFELNGNKIERKYEGETIKIIYKIDDSIHLLNVYDDNSGEPRELEKIAENKYKYKGQKTDKYFLFSKDRILFKTDIETIKEYKKLNTD